MPQTQGKDKGTAAPGVLHCRVEQWGEDAVQKLYIDLVFKFVIILVIFVSDPMGKRYRQVRQVLNVLQAHSHIY